jgi:hypothetical protein
MKVFTDGDWVTLSDQEIEYGAYAKLTMMDDKIKRVRELAVKFMEEPEGEMVSYQLAAGRLFTALGGKDV